MAKKDKPFNAGLPNVPTGFTRAPETPSKDSISHETQRDAIPEALPEPPRVRKMITCPRCNGDGVWHTSATGRRLATIYGPTVDPGKPCPKCKGKKKVVQWITAEQAEVEEAERATRSKAAKAKIDVEARAAKKAIDAE